jgi:hypothetical protein
MAHIINPIKNQLLAALPEADWRRWTPHVDIVSLGLGQVLYEAGDTLTHAYFPINSIISLLYVMSTAGRPRLRWSAERRAVLSHQRESAQIRVQQCRPGSTPVAALHPGALITQMTQSAACGKHHSLQQQLCRWILLSLDRLASDNLTMTQQLMANMLGVSLKTMNEGGRALQDKGVIRYADGQISVIDRAGLEKRTGECYGVVKKEYDRLLPDRQAA